ncbi:MAG: MBL fold metallo-hydrolase [Actinomycetota bacterium]|nr:MBL fold metallo-hydrolase [Actinomycetota bacterium]
MDDRHPYRRCPGFATVYVLHVLRGEKGCALFDSGVSGSVVSIIEGLEAAGIAPDEALNIIVSHIHLDHAGGAGYPLKEMLNARVVITDIGMESKMNPERLLKSARRVGGALSSLYGDMIPIEKW